MINSILTSSYHRHSLEYCRSTNYAHNWLICMILLCCLTSIPILFKIKTDSAQSFRQLIVWRHCLLWFQIKINISAPCWSPACCCCFEELICISTSPSFVVNSNIPHILWSSSRPLLLLRHSKLSDGPLRASLFYQLYSSLFVDTSSETTLRGLERSSRPFCISLSICLPLLFSSAIIFNRDSIVNLTWIWYETVKQRIPLLSNRKKCWDGRIKNQFLITGGI